jgi:hypothetical protein
MNLQKLAEERSLAYHRLIAARLPERAEILDDARKWLAKQRASGGRSQVYFDRWAEILERPIPEIQQAIVDPSEGARALRQCSPFAGLIDARERLRIWREVRGRLEAGA